MIYYLYCNVVGDDDDDDIDGYDDGKCL